MQLMAELSGEQGSSADLLRRLEQAESKAAALEAKVQVLAACHAWLLLCLAVRQSTYGLQKQAEEPGLLHCRVWGLIPESASTGRQYGHLAAACRRPRGANGSSHIWWGTCSGHAKRLLWLPSRPLRSGRRSACKQGLRPPTSSSAALSMCLMQPPGGNSTGGTGGANRQADLLETSLESALRPAAPLLHSCP